MPLRDLLLAGILAASIPLVVRRPWLGILLWYWIGLMNPHRLTWGFMYDFPVAMLVAVITAMGLVLARDREPPPLTKEMVLLAGMVVWFTVTSYFAWVSAAWNYWEQFMKILLFTFLTPVLIHGRRRVEFLVLVITASIAFYGAKGGWFSITGGFQNHVLGPPKSFIRGNTSLGLALVMILPLILVVSRQLVQGRMQCLAGFRWSRWAGWAGYLSFWLTGLAILGTFSRGAMLALAVVAPLIFLLMRHKVILAGLGVAVILAVGVTFPDRVVERMETLQNIEEDGSAMSRIESWGVNWNIARENPLTGAGFNLVMAGNERWLSYSPMQGEGRTRALSAHSNYFQVLGHHGFVGLGLYLGLLGAVCLSLGRLALRARRRKDTEWISEYAWAILVGTIGYVAAGAFLDMAYFTLFYAFVALTVVLRREYKWALEAQGQSEFGQPAVVAGEHRGPIPHGARRVQTNGSNGPNRYGAT